MLVMKIKNTYLSIVVLLAFLIACKKDSIIPADESEKYFPLQVGRYTIFDVDSIHFNEVTMLSDTTHFQIMEKVMSMSGDSSSGFVYSIYRYRRMNDTLGWDETDQWSATINSGRAEKVEENLRFIKMVFPIRENTKWQGNKFIDTVGGLDKYYGWVYEYKDINQAKQINNYILDSTVTVTEQDDENLIEKDFEQEIYAKNIGLVYRIKEHVSKQNTSTTWDHPEKGTILIMKVNEIH